MISTQKKQRRKIFFCSHDGNNIRNDEKRRKVLIILSLSLPFNLEKKTHFPRHSGENHKNFQRTHTD